MVNFQCLTDLNGLELHWNQKMIANNAKPSSYKIDYDDKQNLTNIRRVGVGMDRALDKSTHILNFRGHP